MGKTVTTYLIDGEYKSIYPGEKLELSKAPVSWTSNVSMTVFRRETNQEVILNKKKRTVKN